MSERTSWYNYKIYTKQPNWGRFVFSTFLLLMLWKFILNWIHHGWKLREKKYRRSRNCWNCRIFGVIIQWNAKKSTENRDLAYNAYLLFKQQQSIAGGRNRPTTKEGIERLPKTNKRGRCYIRISKSNLNPYSIHCNKCQK